MNNFDLQKLIDRLLVKYPAFASTIVNTNYREEPNDGIATDGENIYYDLNYLNKLTFDEQLFIFAHEICHIRSNHILRSKGKNQKLWNIATDAVINALLKEDGLTMPKDAVAMPDAINYSAEEYYEKLVNENKQNPEKQNKDSSNEPNNSNQGSNSQGNNETQDNSPSGLDNHSMRSKGLGNEDKQNPEKQNEDSSNEPNNSNQGSNPQGNNQTQDNSPSGLDNHSMWSKRLENENNSSKNEDNPNEQELFSQNRKEKIEKLKKLKDELLNESLKVGTATNSEQFYIDDIGVNKPLIDWRIILRKAVNIKLKWDTRRPEVEYGILTPKLRRLAYPRTEILLDTSGSIDEEMLRNFLRECKYILQNTEMWVGCFDTKFYGFQKINSEKDIENMTFYGRGGTNFDVAINAFSQRVDNKIIFTDGYADMPKEKNNVIWVVFGTKKINPLGGQVIYINKEQLKELQSVNRIIKR